MNRVQLEQVITEQGKNIFSFCVHLTGDILLAEDLYQDTFLKAIELDSMDFSINPKSYLLGIRINLWKNKKRKLLFRQRKIKLDLMSETEELVQIADEDRTETELERKELHAQVRNAVHRLNDNLKTIVLLYYMEQMTVTDISFLLGLPQGTVKSRLYKARKILKKELEDLI